MLPEIYDLILKEIFRNHFEKNAINATKLDYTHMNLHLYRKKSIHYRIHNYSHMEIFAVCLQSDRESYNWGLSSISVGLKPIYIKWTLEAKNKS